MVKKVPELNLLVHVDLDDALVKRIWRRKFLKESNWMSNDCATLFSGKRPQGLNLRNRCGCGNPAAVVNVLIREIPHARRTKQQLKIIAQSCGTLSI